MKTRQTTACECTDEVPSTHPAQVSPTDERATCAMTGVPVKLSRLLLDLYPLALSSPIGEFEDQLFLLLHEHFSFDFAWLGKFTMILQGPLLHNCYLHQISDKFVADWEQVKTYDPIVPQVFAAPKQAVFLSMAEENLAVPFRNFLSKYAVAQALCCACEDPLLKLWTFLTIFRNSLLPAFDSQETELLELAMPHLASALNMNRLHYMQHFKAAKLTPRSSFAISDIQGVLQYADASFADLMLMEWSEWHGAMLPRVFRNLQQEKNANLYVGKLITLQAEQISDLLLINAKPRSAIDVLTPRELTVARLYGEGMTYKAVAKQMAISPATVRHHLRQAYAKLRIQNKGEIAWLLSREEPGSTSSAASGSAAPDGMT